MNTTTTTERENAYGERIRAHREAAGLTQRQLGRLITGKGDTKAQLLVSRIERGERVMNAHKASVLGAALRRALGADFGDPPHLDRSAPRGARLVPRVVKVAVSLDHDEARRLEDYASARGLTLPAALTRLTMLALGPVEAGPA